MVGGVEGLPYLNGTSALLTVPTPVVLTETRDMQGSISTVVTGAHAPAFRGNTKQGDVGRIYYAPGGGSTPKPYPGIWLSIGNSTAADASYATYSYRPVLEAASTTNQAGGMTRSLQAGG